MATVSAAGKPAPSATPTTGATGRRLSARMGISTTLSAASSTNSPKNKVSTTVTSVPSVAPVAATSFAGRRRQTLTGIRTSVNFKHTSSPLKSEATTPKQQTNAPAQKRTPNHPKLYKRQPDATTPRTPRTPKIHVDNNKPSKKSNNGRSRRHLTIGYSGEPVLSSLAAEARSPLRERQNITVQRSKSAQTPLQKKVVAKKSTVEREAENLSIHGAGEQHPMVRRSHSLRNENEVIIMPNTTTPARQVQMSKLSVTPTHVAKVKRNHSDRTPKGRIVNHHVQHRGSATKGKHVVRLAVTGL